MRVTGSESIVKRLEQGQRSISFSAGVKGVVQIHGSIKGRSRWWVIFWEGDAAKRLSSAMDGQGGRQGAYHTLLNIGSENGSDPQPYVGLYDRRLPCCGCGVGWFSFLIGFFMPLVWYYGTYLFFAPHIQNDPRERSGLAACAIAALVNTVAYAIALVILLVQHQGALLMLPRLMGWLMKLTTAVEQIPSDGMWVFIAAVLTGFQFAPENSFKILRAQCGWTAAAAFVCTARVIKSTMICYGWWFIRTMAEGEENYRGSELQGWLKVKKRTTGMVNYKDGCDWRAENYGFPTIGICREREDKEWRSGDFCL